MKLITMKLSSQEATRQVIEAINADVFTLAKVYGYLFGYTVEIEFDKEKDEFKDIYFQCEEEK